jgi:uncharacterized protein (TIGR02391 family)
MVRPRPNNANQDRSVILFNDKVVLIRQTPDGEQRVEHDAHVLSERRMTLRPNSDVDAGDLIEWVNPAGRKNVYRVAEVNFHNSPPGMGNSSHLDYTEVRVTRASVPRPVQPVRAVTIEGLHPEVSAAAGVLFADGHYPEAVFAAFKAVEARIMSLSPMSKSGSKLMGAVFSGTPAKLDITTTTGQNAQDEREGFKLLFMGAVQGIRNPRGHGERPADTPEEAIEYLALASMLMRRLDRAEKRLADQAASA